MTTLEICCYSVDCAQLAEKAGADRIELCCGQSEGGLTPSIGALMQARETVTIPVHPIVRPRGGDFCYNDNEFAIIKNDIARIRDMGFAGVVVVFWMLTATLICLGCGRLCPSVDHWRSLSIVHLICVRTQ